MLLLTVANKVVLFFSRLSSPHSYTGRSVSKLAIKNFFEFIFFFKRRGLPGFLKTELKTMKNAKLGKSLLILGNGPSASKIDHRNLRSNFDELFVVNNYLNFSFAHEVIPDYFCISDPNSFSDTGSDLSLYITQYQIPVISSHFYRKSAFLQGKKSLYFDDRELHFPFWKNISPLRPRSYASYTFFKALAVAIHFGYEVIYILGLDNTEFKSYVGNSDNELLLDLESFYGRVAFADSEGDIRYKSLQGYPDGLSGRLQSYSLAYGDLERFSKANIVNLDEESLIMNFRKSNFGLKAV